MRSPYDINVGDVASLTQNVPGAGSEPTFTNDKFGRCRLLYISCRLVTDANAGNRHIRITLARPVVPFTVGISTLIIPASTSVHCMAAHGMQGQETLSALHLHIPIPLILIIEPADVLTFEVDGIQAGDAFSLIENDVLVFPRSI